MSLAEIIALISVIPLVIVGIIIAYNVTKKEEKKQAEQKRIAAEKENDAIDHFIMNETFQVIVKRISNYCLQDILHAHQRKLNSVKFTIRITSYGICLNPSGVLWVHATENHDRLIRFQEYSMVDILDLSDRQHFILAFQKQFANNICGELTQKNLTSNVHYNIMVNSSCHDDDDLMTDMFKDHPKYDRQEVGVDANRNRYLYYTIVFAYEKNEW